ncbi:hypothetical protein KIN20_026857 [Parelaphostrongylus tenuis]|uniref:Uncharacterized protein n=1 Tax=Parelaphostrongylus tenuis TaxID=148309 RepID=A0AAD5WD99_PARTN|nr:hypothetical protein KIN20_026857 [Parelaphostrongylus tenuis]
MPTFCGYIVVPLIHSPFDKIIMQYTMEQEYDRLNIRKKVTEKAAAMRLLG